MRLQIGLIARSSIWEQICLQEGIPFGYVDVTNQRIEDLCSLLVVNRGLASDERVAVEEYLRKGGAILGYTQHLLHVAGTDGIEQELKYIVSDHEDFLPTICLMDLGVRGLFPRGANALRTDTNTFAVLAGPLGGGCAVILPFDIDILLHDSRIANKSFYSKPERFPSERVSLVGKSEMRQLIHGAFKYLHAVRGIPYVHLWYFPNDLKSVFAFRIDSDGGSRQEIDELYELGRNHDVAMSWFLDVKSHEQWLQHFSYFVEQEIGLHCYEHQTYPTFDANLKNMTKGLQEMRRAGLQPMGFASPFGIWNPGLARAIDQLGFEYSSEFSFAYDTLPFYPEADGSKFKALQVPIHPICIGSMLRVGYSALQMRQYFTMIVNQKISRNELLFFYHHPSHQRSEVVADLFGLVRQSNIEGMTMGAYARWWKGRADVRFTVDFVDGRIHIPDVDPDAPNDVWLHIVNPGGHETTLPIDASIDLKSIHHWTVPEKPASLPTDIRRIREFDPRQIVGELYNTLMRKL